MTSFFVQARRAYRIALVVVALAFAPLDHAWGQGQNPSHSKLSVQLYQHVTAGALQIINAHPSTLKVIKFDTNMREALRTYKQGTPNGVTIVRHLHFTPSYGLHDSPVHAAHDWFNLYTNPGLPGPNDPDRHIVDFVEGPNEQDYCPTFGGPAESAWFNQFWLTLTPLIVNRGYKPCLASMAVGNPPGSQAQIDAVLREFVPALRQAKAVGGAWAYHSYSYFLTKDATGVELDYSLRYRRFYDFFAREAPDLLDMPMLLTEGGAEGGGGGWKVHTDEAGFTSWLTWYDAQLKQDAYIKGYQLFEIGDPGGWWSYDVEPLAPWLAAYLQNRVIVPSDPTEVTTTSGPGKVALFWKGGYGSSGYHIKRSNTSGGPYAVVATVANKTPEEKRNGSTDTGLIDGMEYYYVISGLNTAGESGHSQEVRAVPMKGYAVNAGGLNAGRFGGDGHYVNGNPWRTTTGIGTSGAFDPAPPHVYQTERVGDPANPVFSYHFSGLPAHAPYLLRLHFAEIYYSSAGARRFHVAINGHTVLHNFDIVAAAGGPNTAVIREFAVSTGAEGSLTVTCAQGGSSWPKISGIEVMYDPAPAPLETIDTLTNMSFRKGWNFAPEPQAPPGWRIVQWSGGGPMYCTGEELAAGRPSDSRCKFELDGGAGSEYVLAKEIEWGPFTVVKASMYSAGRRWDGSSSGTMSIGIDPDGNAASWADASAQQSRASHDAGWTRTTLANVARPPGAARFTLMLRATRTGSSWNCQFDEIEVVGVSTGVTPSPTPSATPSATPTAPPPRAPAQFESY